MHELSVASAIVDTAVRHAAGRRVTAVHLRVGHLRQVVPDVARVLLRASSRATRSARARGWSRRSSRRACAATRAAHEWEIDEPDFRCPACGAADVEVVSGEELEVESIEVEERRPHAPRQGEGRRGRARRQQHDRARQPRRLRPPRRHGRQPDERAGRGQDDAARARCWPTGSTACASACSRATCRARWTPTGSPACTSRSSSSTPTTASAASATSTPTWSARRCRRCRCDEIDLLDHRERRQPRLPGRVPRRRGRAGDGLLGHRGRGQAAQVPADVPRLRARGGQQDRPAAAPRLRPRPLRCTTSTPCTRTSPRMLVSARTGEGVDALRDWLGELVARAREPAV